MAKEREDYIGPLQDQIDLNEFSKAFLLKIMRLWGEFWEGIESSIVRIGGEMEGVGVANANELLSRAIEDIGPSIFERVADLAKVDKNTIVGRIKAGRFIPDNIYEKYPGHFEVISPNEVRATYSHCHVADKLTVGDIETLRLCCQYVEPRIAAAYMNYPGARKVKVEMLKIPENLPLKEGEPCCIWRFTWEDAEDEST